GRVQPVLAELGLNDLVCLRRLRPGIGVDEKVVAVSRDDEVALRERARELAGFSAGPVQQTLDQRLPAVTLHLNTHPPILVRHWTTIDATNAGGRPSSAAEGNTTAWTIPQPYRSSKSARH